MMPRETPDETTYAENPHAWFDGGRAASVLIRRWGSCLVLAATAFLCASAQSMQTPVSDWPTNVPVKTITSAAKSLPMHQSPLEHSFQVRPGQVVDVVGAISDSALNKANPQTAIFLINFYDRDGADIRVDELRYTELLKGHFKYLTGGRTPIPFNFRITVPPNAVVGKIRVAKCVWDHSVVLTNFSCVLTRSGDMARKRLVACLLLAVAGIAWWLLRHGKCKRFFGMCDEMTSRCATMRKVLSCCLLALTVVVGGMFAFCAIASVVEQSTYTTQFSPSTVLEYLLFLVLASAVVCCVFKSESRRRRYAIPAIMLICFACHAITISLTHSIYVQTMISDFYDVERCIMSPVVRIAHASEYSYWCNYELLCSVLGKIFCKDIRVAQYLNAVCCVAALFPVFRLSERVSGFFTAVFVTLLVGISPIMFVYGTILVGDFIAAAAYIYAFYFIICMLETVVWTEKFRYALFAGVSLGIGQLMKPLSVVFVAMATIMVFLDLCRFGWRRFIRWGAVFALLLGTYLLTSAGVQEAIVQVAKPQRIKSESLSLAKALLIGLDVKTKGSWNKARKEFVQSIPEEERIGVLRKMIADDYKQFPELFAVKLKRIYSGPGFGWGWYEKTISPAAVSPWLKSSMCVWNLAALILVFLGVAGLAVTRGIAYEKCRVGVAAELVIAAFTSVLLLVEAQERYKIAIYPIFFLVVPYVRTWFSIKGNRVYEGAMKVFAIIKLRTLKRERKCKCPAVTPKI